MSRDENNQKAPQTPAEVIEDLMAALEDAGIKIQWINSENPEDGGIEMELTIPALQPGHSAPPRGLPLSELVVEDTSEESQGVQPQDVQPVYSDFEEYLARFPDLTGLPVDGDDVESISFEDTSYPMDEDDLPTGLEIADS
ncbi:hypothetical protein FQN54_007110 [Arachnomyces sp. PD_36]|nr:hypothetical protein FQN54_007110 [Arachnomyces sp. PD_36]